MKRLIWILVLLAAPSLVSAADSARLQLERTKSLCRGYTEGFVHPALELAYGKRINGPRGIDVLESVEAVAQRTVHGELRPWGYGSGIEDLAYQNGLLIYALCDAEAATGEPLFAEMARRAFRGLKRMSTISPVSGFVPRGPHPADGKTYYPDSSLDQHSLYVCGLWRYHNSRLATPEEKRWIALMIVQVLRRFEKNKWSFLTEDDSAPSQAGGDMLPMRPTPAALLLAMLAAAHHVSGDAHWLELYNRFSNEEHGKRWKLLAQEDDPQRPPRYNNFTNQDMLRTETLRRIEPDGARQAILRRRIERTAEGMLKSSYLKQWNRMWLMSETWAPGEFAEVANAYLKPLGLTLKSEVTVMDMWKRFNQDLLSPEMLPGQRNHYEPMTLAVPAMVWQIALLSQNPELIRQVHPAVQEMFDRVDFQRINLGWVYNYAVLAALWDVANPAEPIRPPGAEYGPQLELKNLGTGPVMDVAATATHLYAIGGGKLFVLDLAKADQPLIVGQLAGLGHVRQIAVQNGIAYITSREDGLFIVNVRRPDQPVLASHYDTIELATGIAVAGEIAAVANRFAGVELLDVRDPQRPLHLSTVRVGEAQSVVFQADFLYAGVWATNELAIVDVRNPRQPRLIATASLDGHGDGLGVRGNLAFAATGHHSRAQPAGRLGDPGFGHGHGLEVFDISDPTHPRFVSRLKFPPFYRLGMDMWGVELAGDCAFVNDTYNGLFVVDIRDPARPSCVAHCQLPVVKDRHDPSPAAGLAIAGGQVYLAGAWSDLHAVTPPVPAFAGPAAGPGLKVPTSELPTSGTADVYTTEGQVHAVLPWREDGQGTLLLVAAGKTGLHVVRRNTRFEPVATYATRGFATDVAFHGDRVYVAESRGGVSMWKANAAAGLVRCGAYEVPGESIRQVVLADRGRVAFLAVGPSRLQAVRWNDDGTATKCLDEQHTGLFYRLPISPVAADDRTILCQWHVSGLYAYEAVDGTARFTGFHYPHGMATHGGSVADGAKWLVVTRGGYVEVAAGDTRSPEIGLVRIKGEDLSGKPMLYGRTLFVAHPFTGAVRAVELADVRRPRLLGKLQLAEHPGFIRLLDDTALVPAGYQGLMAWNYRRESE